MQQQSNANLWGTATAGKQVVITTGWNNKQYRTKADATGKWQVAVTTPKAGGPYTLTFNDGQTTSLKNVLVGEVWLCSGQSNMEMPMKGFKNQPVAGANMDVLKSKNPAIRLFTVSVLLPYCLKLMWWAAGRKPNLKRYMKSVQRLTISVN